MQISQMTLLQMILWSDYERKGLMSCGETLRKGNEKHQVMNILLHGLPMAYILEHRTERTWSLLLEGPILQLMMFEASKIQVQEQQDTLLLMNCIDMGMMLPVLLVEQV